jgi:hypothetical protein
MTMPSASSVKKCSPDFLLIDNEVKSINKNNDVMILSSIDAWNSLDWTKKYFDGKPKGGYFIWVKKQVDFPLSTCVNIASLKVKQDLQNLMVIEKGIKAKANVVCSSLKNNLSGTHKARGKLILKEGASLEYNHVHKWGSKDNVFPDYEFILEANSSLDYNYLNMFPPKELDIKNKIFCGTNSSVNLSISVNGIDSNIRIKEEVFLNGKGAQAISKLKLVGRKNSNIIAESSLIAKEKSKGHIDCQSLMIDNKSKISSIPLLVCENKDAQVTHEASIGKVSEEQLNYLRARGLTEKQAIDLIVSGFLKA